MTLSQQPYSADLIKAAEHIAANHFGKAEAILRPYVKDNPADVNGIRLLGEVGIALGALRDGEKLLARAVELAPKYTEARYGWANALYKRHRYEEAREQLDHLLALDSSRLDWRMLKAATLVEVNEYEEAIELFESVLILKPDHRQAYLSYGHALRAVGRTEDCIVAYEKCVEVATGIGEAYWSLANLKTYRFRDAQIAHIEELLNDNACEFRDYYHLLFSLGKAQEDRGNYQTAMAAYVKGNQVRGKMFRGTVRSFTAIPKNSKPFFLTLFLQSIKVTGATEKTPFSSSAFHARAPRLSSKYSQATLWSKAQPNSPTSLPSRANSQAKRKEETRHAIQAGSLI
jgi:tetratricopeptide (TPR) repeat protein